MQQRPRDGVRLVTTRVREVDGDAGARRAARALTLVCAHVYYYGDVTTLCVNTMTAVCIIASRKMYLISTYG